MFGRTRGIACLMICLTGCVDGDALQAGLRGRSAHDVADAGRAPAADAAPVDAAVDAAVMADADVPMDGAPAPRDGVVDEGPRDAGPADGAADDAMVVCQPEVERCDGLDNDCDDVVDEDIEVRCGPDPVGLCGPGLQTCEAGALGPCVGSREAVDEICDGLDNDCDMQVDEIVCPDCEPQTERPCYSGPPETQNEGACRAGAQRCDADGRYGACVDEVLPAREICNRQDDDCDGAVDEGYDIGEMCRSGVGGCARDGTRVCGGNGAVRCSAVAAPPTTERCNGIDDDCDGETDEDREACYPGPAGTMGRGICRPGTRACGEPGCAGHVLPRAEVCSGLDEDCDGVVDEVPGGCQPCDRATDCDTGGCRQDRCVGGWCERVDRDGVCDDGDWCNGPDLCEAGVCVNQGPAACVGEHCDAANQRCVECLVDDHCPPDRILQQGECGGFVSQCDETGVQQVQSQVYACVDGACVGDIEVGEQACMRATEGMPCQNSFCVQGACRVPERIRASTEGLPNLAGRLRVRCVVSNAECVVSGPQLCEIECPRRADIEICCSNGSVPCGGDPAAPAAGRDVARVTVVGGDSDCEQMPGGAAVQCGLSVPNLQNRPEDEVSVVCEFE